MLVSPPSTPGRHGLLLVLRCSLQAMPPLIVALGSFMVPQFFAACSAFFWWLPNDGFVAASLVSLIAAGDVHSGRHVIGGLVTASPLVQVG